MTEQERYARHWTRAALALGHEVRISTLDGALTLADWTRDPLQAMHGLEQAPGSATIQVRDSRRVIQATAQVAAAWGMDRTWGQEADAIDELAEDRMDAGFGVIR